MTGQARRRSRSHARASARVARRKRSVRESALRHSGRQLHRRADRARHHPPAVKLAREDSSNQPRSARKGRRQSRCGASIRRAPRSASELLHKLAVTGTGAAGGAFGVSALALELPLSTTVMLRSIADIARAEGEDLRAPDAKLACLSVFALGGRATSDDATESAYYVARCQSRQRRQRSRTSSDVEARAQRCGAAAAEPDLRESPRASACRYPRKLPRRRCRSSARRAAQS